MTRGRGSIVFHRGSYVVQLSRGTDPASGKRLRDYHTAEACPECERPRPGCQSCVRAAEQLRTRLLSELDENRYVDPSTMTLSEFLGRWLQAHRSQVRIRTWDNYEQKCRTLVGPRIGMVSVQRLDALALNRFYADLQEAGYAQNTIKQVHATLRKALGDGVTWGIVRANVARDARPPKREEGTDEDVIEALRVWTAPQLTTFLRSLQGSRDFHFFHLAAATGMRRSELCGLKWDMVDFGAGSIRVERTRHWARSQHVWSKPKTKRSRRTIALSPNHVAVLKEWRQLQAAERLAAGCMWEEHGVVFCDETGRPVLPGWYSTEFTRRQKKLDLPAIGLHGLRHTHATLLIEAKESIKTVSERLGHSTTAFTMDRYGHLTDNMQRSAAAAIDRAMGM